MRYLLSLVLGYCLVLGSVRLSAQQLLPDPVAPSCSLPDLGTKRPAGKGVGNRSGVDTWPDGLVPYYMDYGSDYGSLRTAMEKAVQIMNDSTNMCWFPVEVGERALLMTTSEEKNINYARLGYDEYANPPGLIAMYNASVGIGLHEMGHSLGMYHEQQRPDRDEYVTIDYGNITQGRAYAFDKLGPQYYPYITYDTPYDFNSVMHYSSYAFSKNNRPTIIRIDRGKQEEIESNRNMLSVHDIEYINQTYPIKVDSALCADLVAKNSISVRVEVINETTTGDFCPMQEAVLRVVESDIYQKENSYEWNTERGYPSTGTGTEHRVTYNYLGTKTITLRVQRGPYTKLITTTIKYVSGNDELQIVSNPVAPGQPLRYTLSTSSEKYSIQLIDAAGRRVYQEEVADAICRSEGTIATTGLQPGVYWLMYVWGEDQRAGKRVVIL